LISLRLAERTDSLRRDFLAWLAANPPPKLDGRVELAKFVEVSRAWQRKLALERWIAVHWPEEYGGRGATLLDEAVLQECLAAVGSPQLINLFGLTMVGPVLIKHGSNDQKSQFLKRILSAEDVWCQGFSEPEAGSDLAALKTLGVRTNAGWEITGQKVWTSFAQYADWCFVLVRSDTTVAKHKGLSYLLVPMTSKGIEVRPLTQISGDQEFNEVFFDKVQVAAENIVGQPGDGWKIAISTLMYERVVLTFARHLQSEQTLREIGAVLKNRPCERSEHQQFGRLIAESMAVRALALSHLIAYESDAVPGPEGSLDKLSWSESFQRIVSFGLELEGAAGVITGGSAGQGRFQHQYLYSRGRTIAAGTSEIQRNIISERILGLPKP
jgi:alkylation response protein AidB-like acyl-CoA dehydrogenase